MQTARRLILFLLLAVLSGCSNKNIDTANLQTVFQGWTVKRDDLDKGISAITNTNYPAALESLEKVAFAPNLTKEQRKAIEEVVAQLKERIRKSS